MEERDGRSSLILHQLTLSRGLVRRCIDDITDAEAGTRPSAKLAPAVWQVGHLALADVQFAGFAGTPIDVPLPNAYADLFRQGTGGASEYPPLTAVAKTFDGTHTALLRLAETARLDTRLETSGAAFSTVAELLAFVCTHRWYHMGKIASLRGLLDKPRSFG